MTMAAIAIMQFMLPVPSEAIHQSSTYISPGDLSSTNAMLPKTSNGCGEICTSFMGAPGVDNILTPESPGECGEICTERALASVSFDKTYQMYHFYELDKDWYTEKTIHKIRWSESMRGSAWQSLNVIQPPRGEIGSSKKQRSFQQGGDSSSLIERREAKARRAAWD